MSAPPWAIGELRLRADGGADRWSKPVGPQVTHIMLANTFARSLALASTAALFACGPEVSSGGSAHSNQGLAQQKRDEGAMYVCDIPVPPAALSLDALIPEVETDRVYTSARPGFMRQWAPVGWLNGQIFSQLLVQFDTA